MRKLTATVFLTALSANGLLPATCQVLQGRGSITEAAIKRGNDLPWARLPWTGDDTPFVAARKKLDGEFSIKDASGKNYDPIWLLKKYRDAAQKTPKSVLAQFRWAYAARKALHPSQSPSEVIYNVMWGVLPGMASVENPHAYEYDRVRFLVYAAEGRVQGLEDLGRRLMEKVSDDDQVRYAYIKALNWSKKAGHRVEALRQAEILSKRQPDKPSVWSLLGSVHIEQWATSKDRGAAEAAIEAYQKYLEIAPKNYTGRAEATRLIQVLKSKL